MVAIAVVFIPDLGEEAALLGSTHREGRWGGTRAIWQGGAHNDRVVDDVEVAC